ncbi:unnamed protein product [Kluyveromyces dobzhanskii CBS 2104]|uniref:Cysteine protease n=1 Tax=Kluyveromyces dobzhanskii CBS 2104 TaxID=1427455 RepID=A0A0A8L777_9SACH|nr:unnamed protein product [Kluyveromyces dobzhanskii CBS 2104]
MDVFSRISQQLGIVEVIDRDGAVFISGQEYCPLNNKSEKDAKTGESTLAGLLYGVTLNPELLSDVHSRVFFTYRTQFSPIRRDEDGPSPINFTLFFRDNPINTLENALTDPDSFYSDIGWGCMIRTGQSLLANAIQRVKLTRKFRINSTRIDDDEFDLISWFQDDINHPFSLHNFVETERKTSGMKPGQWFGPSATARSIKTLVAGFPSCGIDSCIISTQSADIYEDQVTEIFTANQHANVLLLFAIRLGVDLINSIYWKDILKIISSRYSVGIAGGKPSSSLYFFGHQNENLLYFDPHSSQQSSSDMDALTYYQSCHGHKFNKLHISETDPSMLIGILISGISEWESFKDNFADNQIIQFLETKLDDALYQNFDLSIGSDSMHSIESDIPDTGDYVDVGILVSGKQMSSPQPKDEEFEDVKCKSQRIIICEDPAEPEVEQVLVEDSSSQ